MTEPTHGLASRGGAGGAALSQSPLVDVLLAQRVQGQRVLLRLGVGAAQGRRVHGLLEGMDVHGGRHGNGLSRGDWRRSVAALERIQACNRALASGI